MKKHISIHIVFMLLLLLCSKVSFAQSEEQQKGMWILNSFIPNITWPQDESIEEYKIGLLAASPELYNYLLESSKKTTIKGRKFKVMQFSYVSNVGFVHALYIGPSLNNKVKSIAKKAHKNTLIITDKLEKSDEYMINFLDLLTTRKKYEINPGEITSHGLTIGRSLFIHGGKTEDLKKLFVKLKKDFSREQQKFNKVSGELAKTTNQFNNLKKDNTDARIKNQKQKEINDRHRAEIEKRQNEISDRENQLLKVKSEIDYQAKQLDINRQILENKYTQMKESQDEIKSRRDKIEEQNALIQKKKKEIKSKDVQLSEQEILMSSQRIVLIIFIALLLVAVVMAIIVWRGYTLKRRVNKKLQSINKEISSQKEEILNQHTRTEMLNKELERLSIVASKTGNAVTIMDANGTFEWINVGFTKLYGYTFQLLTNELDDNLIGISAHPDIENIFNKCNQTKTTQVYESKNRTRSGEYVWVQTSLTPITDQEGNITKFITIETDVTNIKESENKIRKQHDKVLEQTHELEKSNKELERLSLVASETENAISIMDAVGNFQWINDGFSRLYGYSFNKLIKEYSKNIINRDTDFQTIKLIKKSIEEKIAVTFDRLEKHADGNQIWVQTTLSPIINTRNEISNLIAISTDISKLKEAEQFIIQKNKELIEQQKEIVIQKDMIDTKNQHINASITYAQTIQNAILPPESFLNKIFKTFVVYQSLELVSGDFYWSSILHSNKTDSHIVFYAVVDCTGHGVPGAFMSMIGSSLLDEIINEKQIFEPHLVLENMNEEIQSMLRQESAINNDSMDVCLCTVEKLEKEKKVKVVFAGAKRPLYYFSQAQNEMVRVKGSRKTIGGIKAIRNKEKFVDHTIILDEGDYIYLSTDGIIDQPSETSEKFGSKRLSNLLQQIKSEDLNTQKEILEKRFSEHVGSAKKRDDVCFMAVQL